MAMTSGAGDFSDIVYFDLETQRTANDVGGWSYKDRMGMSVGVTFSTKLGEYRIFDESMVDELIDQLVRADLVVGFNHIGFDYAVLQGYTAWDIASQAISLDLMLDLEKQLGHRLKLDAVATATLGGKGKTADGLEAIRWWQEGRIEDIARYCCFDVKITRQIHEFGIANGHVKFHDRFKRLQMVEVGWDGHVPKAAAVA